MFLILSAAKPVCVGTACLPQANLSSLFPGTRQSAKHPFVHRFLLARIPRFGYNRRLPKVSWPHLSGSAGKCKYETDYRQGAGVPTT